VETSAAADELRPLFHHATPPRQTQMQNHPVSKVPKLQILISQVQCLLLFAFVLKNASIDYKDAK
jgi:hypothetical protein